MSTPDKSLTGSNHKVNTAGEATNTSMLDVPSQVNVVETQTNALSTNRPAKRPRQSSEASLTLPTAQGNTVVQGRAPVQGNITVKGNATAQGNAAVKGNAVGTKPKARRTLKIKVINRPVQAGTFVQNNAVEAQGSGSLTTRAAKRPKLAADTPSASAIRPVQGNAVEIQANPHLNNMNAAVKVPNNPKLPELEAGPSAKVRHLAKAAHYFMAQINIAGAQDIETPENYFVIDHTMEDSNDLRALLEEVNSEHWARQLAKLAVRASNNIVAQVNAVGTQGNSIKQVSNIPMARSQVNTVGIQAKGLTQTPNIPMVSSSAKASRVTQAPVKPIVQVNVMGTQPSGHSIFSVNRTMAPNIPMAQVNAPGITKVPNSQVNAVDNTAVQVPNHSANRTMRASHNKLTAPQVRWILQPANNIMACITHASDNSVAQVNAGGIRVNHTAVQVPNLMASSLAQVNRNMQAPSIPMAGSRVIHTTQVPNDAMVNRNPINAPQAPKNTILNEAIMCLSNMNPYTTTTTAVDEQFTKVEKLLQDMVEYLRVRIAETRAHIKRTVLHICLQQTYFLSQLGLTCLHVMREQKKRHILGNLELQSGQNGNVHQRVGDSEKIDIDRAHLEREWQALNRERKQFEQDKKQHRDIVQAWGERHQKREEEIRDKEQAIRNLHSVMTDTITRF